MSKIIVFRFATPDPLKFEVRSGTGKDKKTTVQRRNWDGDKLLTYIQEHLPPMFENRFPDYELRIEQARKRDIQLEGWKPSTEDGDAIKERFDELVGELLGDLEMEDFLVD